MEKWKKMLMILTCLVVMCIALLTLTTLQNRTGVYIFNVYYRDFLVENELVTWIILWFNASLFLLLFVIICVIGCYPMKITKLKFQKNNGAILIDRKGIKGFVLSSLREEQSIKNPSVHIKMTKKKIRVFVKGKIGITSDIYGRTEKWESKMEEQIQQLVGREVGIKTKVKLNGYVNEKHHRVDQIEGV